MLSRSEFVFNFDRAVPVLRYVYFGLLDQNRDGQLLGLMKLEFDVDLIARLRSLRYYGGLPLDARTVTDEVIRQEGK